MDVRTPKPVRRWRDFATEIGTIVLGVLIALGAEQLADQARWLHKMSELRAAMRVELGHDDGPQAWSRMATRACFDARLDDIQRAAEAGRDRAVVAALAAVYPVTDATWDMDAWRTLQSGDGGAHMSPAESGQWSDAYSTIPELERLAQDERDALSDLQAIRPAPGPMSEAERAALAHAVQRLRVDNRWIAHFSERLLTRLPLVGAEPSPSIIRRLARGSAGPLKATACRRVSTP